MANQARKPAANSGSKSGSKAAEPKSKSTKTTTPPAGPSSAAPGASALDTGLDVALALFNRFRRFGWDIVGVVSVTISLLTVLALLGLDGSQDGQRTVLFNWAQFLRHWLGWGSGLVAVALAGLAWWAFRARRAGSASIRLGQLLALEALAFLLLAGLALLGGVSLDRAQAGLDGGLLGWVLAEFPVMLGLPAWARTLIYSVLLVGLSFGAIGLNGSLLQWIDRQAGYQPDDSVIDVVPIHQPVSNREPAQPALAGLEADPVPVAEPAKPDKPRASSLPAEFRKAFSIKPAEPEQPVVLPPRDPRLPPLTLLGGEQSQRPDERHINQTAGLIEKTMAEFGIPAKVVGFRIGPTVTQYAVEPGFVEKPGPDGKPMQQKVRVSQISGLSRDLALALSAERLRIEAPVPGRSYVGIEVPNTRSTVVRLRPIMEAEAFFKVKSPLAVALGRDVSGHAIVADLARMPHLLIAGTTGSGKSVCIAALTACLVINNTPETLRLAMIDPKMVELVRFNGLPHLLGKVETDLERILAVLKWALAEMDHRYRLLESAHARDLESYNRKLQKRGEAILPRIVVMIDELADLMMSAPDQTEHSLVRLAQMARAVGIHLVVATQRPSTDVVTGLIKANFPARIAFTVASGIDSRVILDTPGAETLLGRGDMLFLNPEAGVPLRAQGVYITDQEVEKVQEFWRESPESQGVGPCPWEELMNQDEGGDALIQQSVSLVRGMKRVSTSLLQRRLRIGYPRAARLMDELEEMGVVGPSQGGGRDREVLLDPDDEDGDSSYGDSSEEME